MEKKYELVALFPTKMNDILAEKTMADLVKNNGFKVVSVDKWGIKPLVYPIKKETKAYYLKMIIEGEKAKELTKALKIDETMLRYLLIKLEKGSVAKKAQKSK